MQAEAREDQAAPQKRLSSRQEPAGRGNGSGAAGTAQADGAAQVGGGTMLMRSTGLGKAELVAEIVSVKHQGDYLIMHLRTTEPVRWKIRVGISHRDLRGLLKVMLRPSFFRFLFNIRAWFRPPAHPGDF